MFAIVKNLSVVALIVSLLGCGGDGSVSLDGGSDGSDPQIVIPTSVAFFNLYANPYDSNLSLPLDLYYGYSGRPSNPIAEGVNYSDHNGDFVSLDDWSEDIDNRNVIFTVVDSNTGTTVGQAGSTFNITKNTRNFLFAYGYIGSDKGLRLTKQSFLKSRPSNQNVNVRLLNTYSFNNYEGPLDFYMSKEDGGELSLVASSVRTGEISDVITVPAHPFSNKFAILPAGAPIPAATEDWLFYEDFTYGLGLNGGNNYIMLPVVVPSETPDMFSLRILPLLEFVIERD